MGERFHRVSGYEIQFCPDTFRQTVESMIGTDKAVIGLLVDVRGLILGMIGAMIVPCYFNHAARFCAELFWWVDPEHRRGIKGALLLRWISEWAKEHGCQTIAAGHLESYEGAKMAR